MIRVSRFPESPCWISPDEVGAAASKCTLRPIIGRRSRMATALALRTDGFVEKPSPLGDRQHVLARYHKLREISKRHHDEALKLLSDDAILHQARRLGLARGKTLILDDMNE